MIHELKVAITQKISVKWKHDGWQPALSMDDSYHPVREVAGSPPRLCSYCSINIYTVQGIVINSST